MKRFISAVSAAVIAVSSSLAIVPEVTYADNPLAQNVYTADPAPMVYNGICYLYTSHDADASSYFTMPDWQCYSSTDMKNWTHHGTVLSGSDFSWAEKDTAWATQCIERNGKFYMYCPLSNASGGGRAIGVAVSDSPTGPFIDAIGKPLVGPNWDYIDPTVFIDDDGQAYLYFGNPQLYYVKLNDDMISYSGEIQKVDMSTSSFGTRTDGDERHQTLYEEGPWFYRRGDLYYMVYAASGIPEEICYSTSPTPTGPWTFGGKIMESGGGSFTNHPGICDYKGKSYFFYHTGTLPGGGGFNRSVAVEEFTYGADGSIPMITRTDSGAKQISALNPFVRNEAETICWESGIETETCSNGGMNVANIENGDYIKVSGVDFSDGAATFTASASSAGSGGTIEIHLDSLDGTLAGSCAISSTDGWQNWKEFSCDVSGAEGVHDVYFKYTGGSGYLFNVDWWKFGSAFSGTDDNGYYFHSTYEDNLDSWSARGGVTLEAVSAESFMGSKSLYVSGRTASWNGASRPLSSIAFVPGEAYSFSANVMYNTGGASDTFYMKLQYTDENGDTQYSPVAEGTAVKGEWIQLANTNYIIPDGASDLQLYIETADSTNSYYADEIIGAEGGTVIAGAGEPKKIIPGDVNFDEVINSLDVSMARKILSGSSNDKYAVAAADVNGNGSADDDDLVQLQDFVLGQIDSFTIAEEIPPVLAEGQWNNTADISWIDPNKPMVALSFDDGPVGIASDDTSTRIQNVISENGFHATFFYVVNLWGRQINDTTKQEILRAQELGFEIANHTYSHPDLTNQTAEFIQKEINDCSAYLTELTGQKNFLVRPPYLSVDDNLQACAPAPLITRAVDSYDWNNKTAQEMIDDITARMNDGSLDNTIVLMHETYEETTKAVEYIVPMLKANGWQVVTISEMFKVNGKEMFNGQIYTDAN